MDNPVRRAEERQNLKVVVERLLPARRERVFRAWTDPALMEKWFAPPDLQAVGVEAEAVVGGSYRIGMRQPDGSIHVASGKYLEVVPPERLVFTWAWQTDPPGSASRVTVEFFEQGESTRLVLTHERLATQESAESHRQGWEGCLEQLGRFLSTGNP